MARWSKSLGNSVNFAVEDARQKENFLKNFFEERSFVPTNEEEMQEYDDFSFISTAVSLLVYLAKSDGRFTELEKAKILEELIFQLEQYPHEYKVLSSRFGKSDREIIEKLIKIFEKEIDEKRYDIDKTIEVVNLIYQNNPYKKYFLIRLCYVIIVSDSNQYSEEQLDLVKSLSLSFEIDDSERERIFNEVITDFKKNIE